MKTLIIPILLAVMAFSKAVQAQDYHPLETAEIDELANKALEAFNVPGMAIAVVKDDEVVHAKGYGISDINTKTPVTKDTLFQIASNTKSMTAAALAILMDEGKLTWDDKVIDYLPEFRLVDPYATREFTIRDMLTHRSGLPLGAGDLLFWPDKAGDLQSVFKALSIIPPATSFRSKYAYDNLLYILAGEIVSRVSGMAWADFVEKRIFAPLEIEECRSTHARVPEKANQATPHIYLNGELQAVSPFNDDLLGAAGGVNCSVSALTAWLRTQLHHGRMPGGGQLFSKERHAEMWTPVTIIQATSPEKIGERIDISHYALGWYISEYDGYQRISHGGGLIGMVSYVMLLPEVNLGILVFTNQQNGYAIQAVTSPIISGYINKAPALTFDEFVSQANRSTNQAEEQMKALWEGRNKESKPSLPLSAYAQIYNDPWYGDVEILEKPNGLYFRSTVSPSLRGWLKHFQYDTFVVEWDDRTLFADAYVRFILDEAGTVERIDMKKFDPRTDFSYDFHHLDLRPDNGSP